MSIKVTPVNEGLDKDRAADLLAEIEAVARRHGFQMLAHLDIFDGQTERAGMGVRLYQYPAADAPISGPDLHEVRAHAAYRLERAAKLSQPPSLLEPYDWGPGGVPEGQPIRYEPGKGWKVGDND